MSAAMLVATAALVPATASASPSGQVTAWCWSSGPARFACLGDYWPPPQHPIAYIWQGVQNADVDSGSVGGVTATSGSCQPGLPSVVEFHAGPLAEMQTAVAPFTCA